MKQVLDQWYLPLRSIILIVLGFILYSQTFHYPFQFDDDQFIVQNTYIRDLNHLNGVWHFLPFTRLVGIYSFAWNYALQGLDPWGYHVFNFIIHLLATFFVWALAYLVLKISLKNDFRREIAFIIALLFLVHPCQTQAVTYVSQRFESMATLLYIAAIYFYLLARISKEFINKVIFFVSTVLVSVLALFTKEVSLTIPIMILAVEWILNPAEVLSEKKESSRKVFIYFFIIFGAVVFFLLFSKLLNGVIHTFNIQTPSASHEGDTVTFSSYLITQFRVFLTFMRLFFVPVHQNLDYDYPLSISVINPPLTLIGLLVMIGMGCFIWIKRKAQPLISFGLAWMLITFSINLAPRENVIFEHKMYLISFGFLLSFVLVLSCLIKHRNLFFFIVGTLVMVLSLLTYSRNQVWKSPLTLWQDVLEKSPQKTRVYVNLAKAQVTPEEYEHLIQVLSRRLQKDPQNYGAYMARAAIYFRLGKYEQSNGDLIKASMIRHSFIDYYKLSIGYFLLHKDDLALEALNKSLELNPNFFRGYLDRGMYWMKQKKYELALKDFDQALHLSPTNLEALVDRAGLWVAMAQYEKALKDLNVAQELDPTNALIQKNKLYCLNKLKTI